MPLKLETRINMTYSDGSVTVDLIVYMSKQLEILFSYLMDRFACHQYPTKVGSDGRHVFWTFRLSICGSVVI